MIFLFCRIMYELIFAGNDFINKRENYVRYGDLWDSKRVLANEKVYFVKMPHNKLRATVRNPA